MKYNDFKIKMKELIENNIALWKQTHIMFIPLMDKILSENPVGEETRVRYDIDQIWEDFAYKENKILFFIDKYLNNLSHGLELYDNILNKKKYIYTY